MGRRRRLPRDRRQAAARGRCARSCGRSRRRGTRSLSAGATGEARADDELASGSAEPLAAIAPSGSAEPSRLPRNRPLLRRRPTPNVSRRSPRWRSPGRRPDGLAGGERNQVMVHVDAETLATDSPGASVTGTGACSIADGPGISPETARRLACDSRWSPLVERDGQPLAVGRQNPLDPARRSAGRWSPATAAASSRAASAGASSTPTTSSTGRTGARPSLDNLVLLCRHHHRLVHEGGYSVSLAGDGPQALSRSSGTELPPSPPPPSRPPPLRSRRAAVLTGTGEGWTWATAWTRCWRRRRAALTRRRPLRLRRLAQLVRRG